MHGTLAEFKKDLVLNRVPMTDENREYKILRVDRGREMPDHPERIASKVFVSYSWDDENHLKWVHDFTARLCADGIDAVLDQWQVMPGDQLPEFMERAVRENDFVLVVCTPRYKERSDDRIGGVGYEGDIMTAEVLKERRHRKFIPVLRMGDWNSALPSWLSGKAGINLRGTSYSEKEYKKLIGVLLGRVPQAPPLGRPPARAGRSATSSFGRATSYESISRDEGPIKITEVIAEEVTSPRNDGTPGSALYAVPFRLSRRPSQKWAELFLQNWRHPPSFTTMHRSSIARISGNKIVLDGTTMEEVERYHLATLKLVLDKTNEEAGRWEKAERARLEREKEVGQAHRRGIDEMAKRFRFD
jgi:hypothetical protein